MSEEHIFDEYVTKVVDLLDIRNDVPIKMEHSVLIGMYDMRRIELIKAIMYNIEAITEVLLNSCVAEYQALCRQ